MPVEQMQETLSLVSIDAGTIVFTLINTLILFLAYRFLLHKKVCAILDQRRETINAEMDAATEAKEQAEATKAEYTEKLAESKAEAAAIVQQAVARAGAKEAEIIAEANQEAVSMKAKAQDSIEKEKKKAMNEMKNQISELVVMAAGAVAEKEISADDNEKLIEAFIDKAAI